MDTAINKTMNVLFFLSVIVSGLMLLATFSQQSALAQDEANTACGGIEAAGGDCNGGEDQLNNVIQSVIEILLFVVGIAAVISLIIGGIKYVVSGGDQQAVASAKNTIIYSIVGLIVAVVAYALVSFVFGEVSGSGDGGSAPPRTTCPVGQDCAQ